MFKHTFAKTLALLVVVIMCVSTMSVCLADAYSEYYNAYMTLMANNLIDANLEAVVTMEGETGVYNGHMKVDSAKNMMYYEMSCDGNTIISFTDGRWLYTEMDGNKVKYDLEKTDTEQTEPTEPTEADAPEDGEEAEEAPTFSVTGFVKNFSSLLEPGQIAQLGLLSPINELVVTNTEKKGDTYTLLIHDGLAQTFLNLLSDSLVEDEESAVKFTALNNLTYKATIQNDVVTGSEYGGELKLHVPGKLMSNGKDADYSLVFTVKITFNNPGNETAFELPSTDGYEEVEMP